MVVCMSSVDSRNDNKGISKVSFGKFDIMLFVGYVMNWMNCVLVFVIGVLLVVCFGVEVVVVVVVYCLVFQQFFGEVVQDQEVVFCFVLDFVYGGVNQCYQFVY